MIIFFVKDKFMRTTKTNIFFYNK